MTKKAKSTRVEQKVRGKVMKAATYGQTLPSSFILETPWLLKQVDR